jgi:anti-anti-sigma factor
MTVSILERMPLLRGRWHEVTVISLRGELDVRDAPALQACLAGIGWQGTQRSVVDLTALEFIDCACLGVLARQGRGIQADGGTVELAGPHGAVSRILAVTGLLAGLTIHDTAALAAGSRRGRPSHIFPAAR